MWLSRHGIAVGEGTVRVGPHGHSLEAAAGAVRLRGLRVQPLLAERDALPALLLHRRARASDRASRRRPTWSRRCGTASPISPPECWSTGGTHRFRYGALIVAGSVPLGLTFVLTYMPPMVSGAGAVAWVLAAHLLFRTAYAGVNVPYLAMSARISADPGGSRLRRRPADDLRHGCGRDGGALHRAGRPLADRIERGARPISGRRRCSPRWAR